MFKKTELLEVKLSVAYNFLEAAENLIKALEYRRDTKAPTQYDNMAIEALVAEIKRIGSWSAIRKFTIPRDNEFLFVSMPKDTTPYEMTAVAQSIRRTLQMKEEKLLLSAGDINIEVFKSKFRPQIEKDLEILINLDKEET